MKPIILHIVALFISANCYCQKGIEYLGNLPLKNGFVQVPSKYLHGCGRSDGVNIQSLNDSCFAVEDGKVIAVYDLGGESAVTIETPNKIYHTYSGLNNPFVAQGQEVHKGMFISTLQSNGDTINEMLFLIANAKGNFYPLQKVIRFLKKINGLLVE